MKKGLFLILLIAGLVFMGCATGSGTAACNYGCNILTYCGRGSCSSFLMLECDCR
jgi:hypothetical protein